MQESAASKLPADLFKNVSANIWKGRIAPVSIAPRYPQDVPAMLAQAPLKREGETYVLAQGDAEFGRRFFYPVTSPEIQGLQLRINGIDSGPYGMFYQAQTQAIYWPAWEYMLHAFTQ